MRKYIFTGFFISLWIQSFAAVAADNWILNPSESELGFQVNIGANTVTGRFQAWTADISYNPENPEAAQVTVKVDIASAKIDDPRASSALGGAEWLAKEAHPMAVFKGEGFEFDNDNDFKMNGTLTLKGQTIPFVLEGDLLIAGTTATANIGGVIQRLDYGIGTADPSVSMDVTLDIKVTAVRQSSE